MEGKITNLLIGLVVVSFVFTGFIVFMAVGSNNVNKSFDSGHYNGTFDKINEINDLNRQIELSQANNTVEQSSADILGSYFKQGYASSRLLMESGGMTTEMLNSAESEMKIEGSSSFFTMISVVVVIIVVFSIIIYLVVGKNV